MNKIKSFFRKVLYKVPMTRWLCNWRIYVLPIIKERIKNPNVIFLIMTPEHGNLGDHALALAETEMLRINNIHFYEVTGRILDRLFDLNCLGVFNGKTIVFNGGGYLGTLWYGAEKLSRNIILDNKKSKIIILPNTIFYEESEWGNSEKNNSIEIYNSHKNLLLYAREKISYDYMNELYKNVKICPDMVLSLNKDYGKTTRNGCLVCLRNDIEKTITPKEEEILFKQINNIFGDNYRITDMIEGDFISIVDREKVLEKKFNQFKSAELVVTDRLHGMIFCAITATPCIVVNSKSPKVKGCYEWIKTLEYIYFLDNVSDIENVYNNIPKKVFHYDNTHLQHYYKKLAEKIKNI